MLAPLRILSSLLTRGFPAGGKGGKAPQSRKSDTKQPASQFRPRSNPLCHMVRRISSQLVHRFRLLCALGLVHRFRLLCAAGLVHRFRLLCASGLVHRLRLLCAAGFVHSLRVLCAFDLVHSLRLSPEIFDVY